MKFRFALTHDRNTLLRAAKQLNAQRTKGRWDGNTDGSVTVQGEALVFPHDDADTQFLAFVTENFDLILSTIEERFVIT